MIEVPAKCWEHDSGSFMRCRQINSKISWFIASVKQTVDIRVFRNAELKSCLSFGHFEGVKYQNVFTRLICLNSLCDHCGVAAMTLQAQFFFLEIVTSASGFIVTIYHFLDIPEQSSGLSWSRVIRWAVHSLSLTCCRCWLTKNTDDWVKQ